MPKDDAMTLRQTYSAFEVAEYLGISRAMAYCTMQADGFPSFRIGKRILVKRADFETWLNRQQIKGVC